MPLQINIGICDDEKIEINYLKSHINMWGNLRGFTILINEFSSAEQFLFEYEENKNFDILLLDIQMQDIDGITLAKTVRKDNETVQIIFVTGFPDFMADGYDVSALHYLLKPVSDQKLHTVLDKAVTSIQKSEPPLFITVDNQNVRVPTDSILYCEVFNHTLSIVTKDTKYQVTMSFSELEKQLNSTFIRCHRSFIASVRHIKSITKTDIIFDNNVSIPMSRRMYHDVNQSFIKYFRGDL